MALLSVCVFCGASDQVDAGYLTLARDVGTALAQRSIRLVYGGAASGLMGAAADGALAAHGAVLGVMPRSLTTREAPHPDVDDMRIVSGMHPRKALMADESHGFLALPGGFGTMDELFEIVTWRQIGLHARPVALLNHQGYYDPLLAWIRHAGESRFIPTDVRNVITVLNDLPALGPWLDTLRP